LREKNVTTESQRKPFFICRDTSPPLQATQGGGPIPANENHQSTFGGERYNKITLFDIYDIVHKTTGATIKNSPEGMSSFVRSAPARHREPARSGEAGGSPDRTKKDKPLCALRASVVKVLFSCFQSFVLS
jgi:hypothetical protein